MKKLNEEARDLSGGGFGIVFFYSSSTVDLNQNLIFPPGQHFKVAKQI